MWNYAKWIGAAAAVTLVVTGAFAFAPGTRGQAVSVSGQDPERDVLARRFEVLAGRGAQIGVSIRDLSEGDITAKKLPGAGGVVVDDVREGSPAARGGLKAGDVVTGFDGERVRGARQFARLVEETPPGRKVRMSLVRDGKPLDLEVTPEEGRAFSWVSPGGPELPARPGAPAFRLERRGPGSMVLELPDRKLLEEDVLRGYQDALRGLDGLPMRRGRLGVGVQDLTPELAEYFGARQGVLVNSVEPDSPAAKAGLKAGDVIVSVNARGIDDGAELRREVAKLGPDRAEATLAVVRDKKEMSLKVTLPGDESTVEKKTIVKRRV